MSMPLFYFSSPIGDESPANAFFDHTCPYFYYDKPLHKSTFFGCTNKNLFHLCQQPQFQKILFQLKEYQNRLNLWLHTRGPLANHQYLDQAKNLKKGGTGSMKIYLKITVQVVFTDLWFGQIL